MNTNFSLHWSSAKSTVARGGGGCQRADHTHPLLQEDRCCPKTRAGKPWAALICHLGTRLARCLSSADVSDHILSNPSRCLLWEEQTFSSTRMNRAYNLTEVRICPVAIHVQRSITTIRIKLQGSEYSPVHCLTQVMYQPNKSNHVQFVISRTVGGLPQERQYRKGRDKAGHQSCLLWSTYSALFSLA